MKLRISQNRKQADENYPEQFLWIKLAWNYVFLSRYNKQETTIEGKTWSRGTNARLPFGVNVILNYSIKSNVYGIRQLSDSSWEFLKIENEQINTVQYNSYG